MNKSKWICKFLVSLIALTLAFGFSGVAQAQLNPVTGTCADDGLILGTALQDSINSLGGVVVEAILDLGGNDIINGHGVPPFVAPCAPGLFEIIVDLAGNDRITGGPGVLDIIVDIAGFNKINTGGGAANLVLTGIGNDEVAGASAPGVSSAVDVFIDLGGANQLNGNGGVLDFLVGGPGTDMMSMSATLFNFAVADFTFGTTSNTLKSQSASLFGVPGVGVLVGAFGNDTIIGGHQATDFIVGLPAPRSNILQGGDEFFTTAPFPGDLIIAASLGTTTVDQILPGKGFDFTFAGTGNDTITLRPGDTLAGTLEPVFCGGGVSSVSVDVDTVLLKGFNSRGTAVTPFLDIDLDGIVDVVLVTDVNSGAGAGYILIFCEVVRFTR